MNCVICNTDLIPERVECGFNTCINCTNQSKYVGAPQISGKTGHDINLIKTDNPDLEKAFNLGSCIIRRRTPKYVLKMTKNRYKRG